MTMESHAQFSADRVYRYTLTRRWDASLPMIAVIGCNPSTADETKDDPTIRKVIGFASRLGFGSVLMLNVGAFRATDPKQWKAARDPFGPQNTVVDLKLQLTRYAPIIVVAAWGKPCVASQRGLHRAQEIKKQIAGMMCWGRNPDGSPRHPLLLPYSTQLESFS